MIVPRAHVGREWDAFVDVHPQGWFWHRSEWLDYCLAYTPGAKDRSFAVVEDEAVRAIWPLIQEANQFAMGGNPLPAQLAPNDLGATEADLLARTLKISRWVRRWQPVDTRTMVFGGRPIPWDTYVLDLDEDKHRLWRDIRKSYKSLINKAERERHIMVTTDAAYVDLCHAIHRDVAGRETRSGATWDWWEHWARRGHLLLALISRRREEGRDWIGFAAAIKYKNWAYYASCATEEDNTAHALQWALIKGLKQDGIRYYEVGWAERPGDTDKDRGIAQFKGGFGARLWTIPAVERIYECRD